MAEQHAPSHDAELQMLNGSVGAELVPRHRRHTAAQTRPKKCSDLGSVGRQQVGHGGIRALAGVHLYIQSPSLESVQDSGFR